MSWEAVCGEINKISSNIFNYHLGLGIKTKSFIFKVWLMYDKSLSVNHAFKLNSQQNKEALKYIGIRNPAEKFFRQLDNLSAYPYENVLVADGWNSNVLTRFESELTQNALYRKFVIPILTCFYTGMNQPIPIPACFYNGVSRTHKVIIFDILKYLHLDK